MAYLWRIMAERFGKRWLDEYGPVPLDSWIVDLADLTPEQLRKGVDAVRDSGRQWPPASPAFRAYCLIPDYDRSDGAQVAARMSAAPALPEPPDVIARRKQIARDHLDTCWKILGREAMKRQADRFTGKSDSAARRRAEAKEQDAYQLLLRFARVTWDAAVRAR